MRRNCSISCLAAPGGAQAFSAHLDPPRDNYDVQSNPNKQIGSPQRSISGVVQTKYEPMVSHGESIHSSFIP